MKRTAIITALTLIFVASATAVVGGPEPGNGEMAITSSGSSASASAATGPNGTEWRSEAAMNGRSQNNTENSVSDIQFSESELGTETSFRGVITAPTPCQVIDHEINKTGENSYTMNVKTVVDELDQTCAQVVTGIIYNGSFSTEGKYQLEIQHDGEIVETVETSDYNENETEESSVIQKVLKWFRNLF